MKITDEKEIKKAIHDLTDSILALPISDTLSGELIVKVGLVVSAVDKEWFKQCL